MIATRGNAAPEVEQTYARARVLCAQIGETPHLFPALRGLCRFYLMRETLPTARDLGEQLDRLAQRETTPTLRLEAHEALGTTLFYLGEYATARMHFEQGIAFIDPTADRAMMLRPGVSPGAWCLAYVALTLWCLGYLQCRPCGGARRRWHWLGRWRIPIVWGQSSTLQPSCITGAATRQRFRHRPILF